MMAASTTTNPTTTTPATVKATATLTPTVQWAQRADVVYVTIAVSDSKSVKLDVSEKCVDFSCSQADATYSVKLDLWGAIDVAASVKSVTARSIFLVLSKAVKDAESWWPRLLAESQGKPHWLKVDFSRWKDEDEEDDEGAAGGAGGMNPAMMQSMMQGGMGGGGGMGMGGGAGGIDFSQLAAQMGAGGGSFGGMGMDGMDGGENDSDDDEMPELEEKAE